MIRDISPFLMGPAFMGVIYWLQASLAHYARDATFFSLQDGMRGGQNGLPQLYLSV